MTPEQAIHELISTEADVPVLFAERNTVPPDAPYITLKLQSSARLPLHLGPVGTDGIRAVSGHRDAQVELRYFGANGLEAMDALSQRLQMEPARLLADALNLAVFSVGQVQQLPVLLEDGTYEPRTLLALSARYTVTLDEDVGLIHTVNGVGTADGGGRPGPSITVHASVD